MKATTEQPPIGRRTKKPGRKLPMFFREGLANVLAEDCRAVCHKHGAYYTEHEMEFITRCLISPSWTKAPERAAEFTRLYAQDAEKFVVVLAALLKVFNKRSNSPEVVLAALFESDDPELRFPAWHRTGFWGMKPAEISDHLERVGFPMPVTAKAIEHARERVRRLKPFE